MASNTPTPIKILTKNQKQKPNKNIIKKYLFAGNASHAAEKPLFQTNPPKSGNVSTTPTRRASSRTPSEKKKGIVLNR